MASNVTLTPPILFADGQAVQGHSYVFAAMAIQELLVERLDAISSGLVMSMGNLSGSGSDVLRDLAFTGLGWAQSFTALSGETDPIPDSGWTVYEDEVTIGRYGLGGSASFTANILNRAGVPDIGMAAQMVPQSLLKTIRAAVCTEAASFATAVGTTGVMWSVDKELALLAKFRETPGMSTATGRILTIRKPRQYTQLINSMRSEPMWSGRAERLEIALDQGMRTGGAFDGLGVMANFASDDVTTSGSDYVGGAWLEGAIRMATASPASLVPLLSGVGAVYPDLGLIVTFSSNGNNATVRYDANAWFGVDKAVAARYPQNRILSSNTDPHA